MDAPTEGKVEEFYAHDNRSEWTCASLSEVRVVQSSTLLRKRGNGQRTRPILGNQSWAIRLLHLITIGHQHSISCFQDTWLSDSSARRNFWPIYGLKTYNHILQERVRITSHNHWTVAFAMLTGPLTCRQRLKFPFQTHPSQTLGMISSIPIAKLLNLWGDSKREKLQATSRI